MRFELIKCHGYGNDFPLIDARALSLSSSSTTCDATAPTRNHATEANATNRSFAPRAGPTVEVDAVANYIVCT